MYYIAQINKKINLRGEMTVRQKRLIQHLSDPDCPSLKKAGERAGYSYKAKTIYRSTLKHTINKLLGSNPELIKERFEDIARRAKKKGDLANETRAIEALARINAMFTDKSINKTEITDGNDRGILAQYAKNRLSKAL